MNDVSWNVCSCEFSDRIGMAVLLREGWEPFAIVNGNMWLKLAGPLGKIQAASPAPNLTAPIVTYFQFVLMLT